MKIVTISDTHSQHLRIPLPAGDIIIHAGDCTPRGEAGDIEEFLRWFGDLDYDEKILIAGNHDWDFERNPHNYQDLFKSYGVTYLNDSGCSYKGLNIWGSPIQPAFCNWAFNRARTQGQIGKHWDLIPENTDILITHGPPFGIGDLTYYGDRTGCDMLLKRIELVKPKLHVYGHIHEDRGVRVEMIEGVPVTFCNASSLDRHYKPWNDDQFVFDWDKLLTGDSLGRDY
jgi:predicted phosphohydrolase